MNAFEAGANTARARRGPSTYGAELFFFCVAAFWGWCFALGTVQRGIKVNQSVAITILLRRQRYPRKYFPFFVLKLRTTFSC